jgi:hypothetical protein
VLAGVMDTRTGQVHYGLNTQEPAPDLHPVLQRRVDAVTTRTPSATLGQVTPQHTAGTHSEVNALNRAMNAAQHPANDENLSRYMLHNVATGRGDQALRGFPPRCTWCHAITSGVQVLEGDEDEQGPPQEEPQQSAASSSSSSSSKPVPKAPKEEKEKEGKK